MLDIHELATKLLRLLHASFKLAVCALYTRVILVYAVYEYMHVFNEKLCHKYCHSVEADTRHPSATPIRPAKTAKGSTSGMAGTNSAALCSCAPTDPALDVHPTSPLVSYHCFEEKQMHFIYFIGPLVLDPWNIFRVPKWWVPLDII